MDTEEPASVTVALGAAGVFPPVEYDGKTYLLGHPTQVAKADYELGVVEAEKRSIAAQLRHGLITPAEASVEKSKLGIALDRGDHKTGKKLWLSYVFRDPETGDTSRWMTGLLVFVHCLFRQNHPAITFPEVQAIADGAADDLKLALKQVTPAFFRWSGGLLGLPPEKIEELVGVATQAVGEMFPTPPTPSDSIPK